MAATATRCFLLLVASLVVLGSGTGCESKLLVNVSDLLPSSPASSPPKGRNGPGTLKVVHRYDPRHLELDRVRVDLLQRRISAALVKSDLAGSEAVQLPAQLGSSLGVANYLVTIGIGTPEQEFTVVMDTGSDMSWIQCAPCATCYQQEDSLFDPTQSSTYYPYPCSSQECGELTMSSCSDQHVCRYEVDYGDHSRTVGNFGKDKLTLRSDVIVPEFMFGCGDHNAGIFGEADGLVGLGRQSISLVSQLSPEYGDVFSYCLPSSSSSSGYLTLGSSGGPPANARYIPMLSSDRWPSFYFVKLTSIEVEGQLLPVNSAVGTIMDSGTVISRLPPAAYDALRRAFQEQMGQYQPTANSSFLDTCYDLTGHQSMTFPTVSLVFDGGASLDLNSRGILYSVNGLSEVCLAFAPTGDANDIAIIGNVQQRTYEVIYDVAHNEIGFVPQSCS